MCGSQHGLVYTCFSHKVCFGILQQVVQIKSTFSLTDWPHGQDTTRHVSSTMISKRVSLFSLSLFHTLGPVNVYLFRCLFIMLCIKVVPNPQSHVIVTLNVKKGKIALPSDV